MKMKMVDKKEEKEIDKEDEEEYRCQGGKDRERRRGGREEKVVGRARNGDQEG